jgi:hypothetical protein
MHKRSLCTYNGSKMITLFCCLAGRTRPCAGLRPRRMRVEAEVGASRGGGGWRQGRRAPAGWRARRRWGGERRPACARGGEEEAGAARAGRMGGRRAAAGLRARESGERGGWREERTRRRYMVATSAPWILALRQLPRIRHLSS